LCGGVAPDQVLLNKYSIGEGIAAHQDGPLYESVAAIISLNSSAMICFEEGSPKEASVNSNSSLTSASPYLDNAGISVILPSASLFVFKDKYYECYHHCIPSRSSDIVSSSCINATECNVELDQEVSRSPTCRYSLTFRIVKSVATRLEEFGPSSGEIREEVARRKSWWLSISESSWYHTQQ
jgi:hypothetical protein